MCELRQIVYLLYLALILNSLQIKAQYEEPLRQPLSIGFSLGSGSQQAFPFHSSHYHYEYDSYRILLNYRIVDSSFWKLEITVEPSLYKAQHQLLNEFYVQPKHGSNYVELRELLTMDKSINEYALDIGLLLRHQTFRNLSFFIQGSVGPMISNRYTERMAKGFAFSDIIGMGCSLKLGALQWFFRTGLRHVSNFNLKTPNAGYNAVIMELRATFNL